MMMSDEYTVSNQTSCLKRESLIDVGIVAHEKRRVQSNIGSVSSQCEFGSRQTFF